MWCTGLVAPRHVGSSRTRARTRVPCIGRWILNKYATREALIDIYKTHDINCLWEGNGSEILKRAWRARDIYKQKVIECMLWKETIGATKLFSIHSNNRDDYGKLSQSLHRIWRYYNNNHHDTTEKNSKFELKSKYLLWDFFVCFLVCFCFCFKTIS